MDVGEECAQLIGINILDFGSEDIMLNTIDYVKKKYAYNPGAKLPIVIPDLRRDELATLFRELGFKVGAEVGVERGLYAQQICETNNSVKLFCIDGWKIYDGCPEYMDQSVLDKYYNEVKVRLSPYNFEIIKKYSLDAVKDFSPRSLDFVYIDANHRFDYVMSDIIEWSKIVRPGGIVSGHDYVWGNKRSKVKFDVIEATNAYTEAHQISPWFVLGGDNSSSWFWVK